MNKRAPILVLLISILLVCCQAEGTVAPKVAGNSAISDQEKRDLDHLMWDILASETGEMTERLYQIFFSIVGTPVSTDLRQKISEFRQRFSSATPTEQQTYVQIIAPLLLRESTGMLASELMQALFKTNINQDPSVAIEQHAEIESWIRQRLDENAEREVLPSTGACIPGTFSGKLATDQGYIQTGSANAVPVTLGRRTFGMAAPEGFQGLIFQLETPETRFFRDVILERKLGGDSSLNSLADHRKRLAIEYSLLDVAATDATALNPADTRLYAYTNPVFPGVASFDIVGAFYPHFFTTSKTNANPRLRKMACEFVNHFMDCAKRDQQRWLRVRVAIHASDYVPGNDSETSANYQNTVFRDMIWNKSEGVWVRDSFNIAYYDLDQAQPSPLFVPSSIYDRPHWNNRYNYGLFSSELWIDLTVATTACPGY